MRRHGAARLLGLASDGRSIANRRGRARSLRVSGDRLPVIAAASPLHCERRCAVSLIGIGRCALCVAADLCQRTIGRSGRAGGSGYPHVGMHCGKPADTAVVDEQATLGKALRELSVNMGRDLGRRSGRGRGRSRRSEQAA